MSVNLAKSSDRSPFGGNHSEYTKTPTGAVPEYALSWRRRDMHGVRISWDQAHDLSSNSLAALSVFFGGMHLYYRRAARR